jgi:biofilm PGA synthesis N-glycosyltransferase PgaC
MSSLLISVLQILFWLSALAVVYTYLGYPLIVTLLARLMHRPIRAAPIAPFVSLVIPAYNEASVIAHKLENSLALDYPRAKLEIVVISDGSTDGTNQLVARYADRGVRLLFEPPRRGKIAALNRAVPLTHGEIIVFSDANAMLAPSALRQLVRNFADEQVACVGGEKRVGGDRSTSARGESAYWRYESHLKRCDSAVGSAMGVAGELFAIRRARYTAVEQDSLIEDFVLSLRLVQAGWRVLFEPQAVAWEESSPSLAAEWQRRTRIAAGGFQSIVRLTGMLNPRLGLPAFQYFSHRVLRWLAPFFLLAALAANALLWSLPFYRWTLVAQLIFYLLALVGYALVRLGLYWRPLQMVFYFCFTNLAALAGFFRYVTRSQPVTWKKART